MNANFGGRLNLDSLAYAEKVDVRQRKNNDGIVYFTQQAAVNAAARSVVQASIKNSLKVMSFSRHKWKLRRELHEGSLKLDSAINPIYFRILEEYWQSRRDLGFHSPYELDHVNYFLPSPSGMRVQTYYSITPNYESEKFVPSPDLISFWLDGVNSIRRESGNFELSVLTDSDFQHYSSELTRSLETVIDNFAKLKAYEGGRYHMTFGGKILSTIETLIVDELLVPPSFSSDFVRELNKLMVSQSRMNPRFYGRWGKLIVDDKGDLVFDLVRRTRRTLAQVLRG